jgi:hypothetical protein
MRVFQELVIQVVAIGPSDSGARGHVRKRRKGERLLSFRLAQDLGLAPASQTALRLLLIMRAYPDQLSVGRSRLPIREASAQRRSAIPI